MSWVFFRHPGQGTRAMVDGSSLLLDLDGVVVESVRRLADGSRLVHVLTAPQWVGICPQCGQRSTRSKGWVCTGPRDVQVGPDRPLLRWRKRKWLCPSLGCDRKVFTESVPGVPARARVTPRAKESMATAVLDEDRSVAAVADEYGCGWHTVHDHVVAVVDEILDAEPAPVVVLGIDETRRGKAKWETDPDTGGRVWVDRWDTGLVDITGDAGLLAQLNGRSSAVVIDWLAPQGPTWRAQITHVAIDLSPAYARVAREALPQAVVIADRFHLAKKANDMVDAVRRRVTWTQRGRRGRKADVEWINRRRLLRGAERLTEEQRTTLFAKLLSADPNQDIAAAWIAKELMRDLLSCADRGGLRYEITAALDHFYQFCAACKVPEVISFARTIETWQAPIIAALQTGLTNARTEGYNRIVKHIGRIAFGFRNPNNQRRRVRWACTRRSRRVTPSQRQRHC
ncbi:ISL3 family transposase [Mycobacterium marinum]|uniref:ISL3 family transposase n=1 Tax=Mycobacterium marinum TaxID=1781 RepID=UPI0035612F42